jgi:hypothetical protein
LVFGRLVIQLKERAWITTSAIEDFFC